MEENKSTWGDIVKVWTRIAAVIAAIGIISTFLVKVFNTPDVLTYSIVSAFGVVLLIVSFYVDSQTKYTHEEMKKLESTARNDFTKAMEAQKQMQEEYKKDSDERIESFRDAVKELVDTTKETRRDTLRIQLLMLMKDEENNIDTILKLAQTYFVELHGDWYMTSEFNKWAKKHDVDVPNNIYKAIDDTHRKDV